LVERLGDLGDALANQIVEPASGHDGENGFLRLLRFLLVGGGEQAFRRIEDASGGVLRGGADRGKLAQRIHQHGDLFGH